MVYVPQIYVPEDDLHSLTFDELCEKYDKDPRYFRRLFRKKGIELPIDRGVRCPYCNKPLFAVNWNHLTLHGKTVDDLHREYPGFKSHNERARAIAAKYARLNRKTPSTYGGVCRGRPCYYTNRHGVEIYLRSKVEAAAAVSFDLADDDYIYEPWKLPIEGATDYVPDFYMLDRDYYVEVKHSSYSDDFISEKLPRVHLDRPLKVLTQRDFPIYEDLDYYAYGDLDFRELVN